MASCLAQPDAAPARRHSCGTLIGIASWGTARGSWRLNPSTSRPTGTL